MKISPHLPVIAKIKDELFYGHSAVTKLNT